MECELELFKAYSTKRPKRFKKQAGVGKNKPSCKADQPEIYKLKWKCVCVNLPNFRCPFLIILQYSNLSSSLLSKPLVLHLENWWSVFHYLLTPNPLQISFPSRAHPLLSLERALILRPRGGYTPECVCHNLSISRRKVAQSLEKHPRSLILESFFDCITSTLIP